MAAEGEEGPRLGTTHPYLGPFVRCFNKQIIHLKEHLIFILDPTVCIIEPDYAGSGCQTYPWYSDLIL